MIRFLTLLDKLRTNYWFLPAVMALLSMTMALMLVDVDRSVRLEVVRELGWVYTGGPEGARAVLSAIAGSVISVAGTTFSITIAVLSLASGQFGPRLLRSFMSDRGNQVVLGAFTSTFLYCLLVLRTVRGTDEITYVPHLSVTFGVFLAIVNVGVLIYFINHVAESIQVSKVIERVGDEVDSAIERLFPIAIGESRGAFHLPHSPSRLIRSEESGYIVAIDGDALLTLASRSDTVVKVLARPGDHVVVGVPLVEVWPKKEENGKTFLGTFELGRDRNSFQDAEYALMQVAEIGVRALSSGINDPFTAMACVDRIGNSMCILASRPLPPRDRYDEQGNLRVIAEPYSYPRLVAAAFGHLRQASESQPVVRERIRSTIDLVLSRTDDERFAHALRLEKSRASWTPRQ